MPDNTSGPDSPEDSSRNNPLLHVEYGDLKDINNFIDLEETFLDLEKKSHQLDAADPRRSAVLNDMAQLQPYYDQGYNFHFDQDEYRPERIPPALTLRRATPPESRTPMGRPETAAAARLDPGAYLSVPGSNQRSRPQGTRRTGARNSADASQSTSASQPAGVGQEPSAKKGKTHK